MAFYVKLFYIFNFFPVAYWDHNNMIVAIRKPDLKSKARNFDLKSALRPYLIFLRYLGIVHCLTDQGTNPWLNPWTLYGFFVVIYSWIILLLRLATLRMTGSIFDMLMLLQSMVVILKEVIGITTIFAYELSGIGMQVIFDLWQQLRFKPGHENVLKCRVRNASWCILLFFILASAIQLSGSMHLF